MPMRDCQRGNANDGRLFNCRWLGVVSHGAGLDHAEAYVGVSACTGSDAWLSRYQHQMYKEALCKPKKEIKEYAS